MVCAAWASVADPSVYPLAIFTMTFPVWPLLALPVLVIDFFALRKWAVAMVCSIAASLPMLFTVFPLNFHRGQVPEPLREDSWKLVTYNIYNMVDYTGSYPGNINPGLQYILSQNPDILVLQESSYSPLDKKIHITPEQWSAFRNRYPYFLQTYDLTFASRFNTRLLYMSTLCEENTQGFPRIGCWEVDIHGTPVLVIGVHMRSLYFRKDDKTLYKEITHGKVRPSRSLWNEVRLEVIDKVTDAAAIRARQARRIAELVDSLGYENVVVCGDFNDTPGCYTLRKLSSMGFVEAWPTVGSGAMTTYNADSFIFQIDHVMTRGQWRAWSVERGNLRSSDHFPLAVTFVKKA